MKLLGAQLYALLRFRIEVCFHIQGKKLQFSSRSEALAQRSSLLKKPDARHFLWNNTLLIVI